MRQCDDDWDNSPDTTEATAPIDPGPETTTPPPSAPAQQPPASSLDDDPLQMDSSDDDDDGDADREGEHSVATIKRRAPQDSDVPATIAQALKSILKRSEILRASKEKSKIER